MRDRTILRLTRRVDLPYRAHCYTGLYTHQPGFFHVGRLAAPALRSRGLSFGPKGRAAWVPECGRRGPSSLCNTRNFRAIVGFAGSGLNSVGRPTPIKSVHAI
jgi:hypothetical protein